MLIYINGTDISRYIESITWSGDQAQMARKLVFSYLYPHTDPNIARIPVHIGDRCVMQTDDGETVFDGIVLVEDATESDIKTTRTAYDYAWYLRSKTYGIYKGSSADITRQVCTQFRIPTGALETGQAAEVISTGDKTIYQVITEAYDGLNCCVYMDGTVVCTAPIGSQWCGLVTGDDVVTDAKYKSSAENMVNRVAVIDDNSVLLTELPGEDIGCGIVQDVYKRSGDDKDVMAEAAKLLKGLDNSGSITVRGNPAYRAGRSIDVQKVGSKICGRFNILSDSHTITDAEYTTSLTLQFAQEVTA